MKTKGKLLAVLVLFGLVAASAAVAKDLSVADAEAQLKVRYPRYTYTRIEASPVPNLFIVFGTKNILYFAPETGHLIFGDMWTPGGQNLTENLRKAENAAKLADLPLDLALKLGDGGKNQLIMFTDPDCPFCKKADAWLSKQKNITAYIFFTPLPMHPNAPAKASFILEAPDPVKAYHEVMAGVYDSATLPVAPTSQKLVAHQRIAAELGITGTPAFWANGNFVSGADFPTLERLLTN